MNIVNKLHTLLNEFLHNPVCSCCGLSHKGQKKVCCTCETAIQHVVEPCLLCALSHSGEGLICVQCLSKPKLWQNMIAPLSYKKPVSHFIQLLKYNQKLEVLKALVELVIPKFQNIQPKPDFLIAVPLHQNRYIERGFNQSHEIAILLSKELNIPYSDQYVYRVIDTPRQSDLKLKQREKNIKNAFHVDMALNQYKHIVIIDDVVTTGSTVHELTKQCLKIGIKKVDVWALARTELG